MSRPFAPLLTERLRIVAPGLEDAARRLAYYEKNRAHLAPWDPSRDETFYTLERMERWIRDDRDAAARDTGYSLLVLRRDEPAGAIVGTIGISNVVRGVFRAAHLGYSLDGEHVGLGYMHEALQATIAFAFGPLDLHRLMANYQPTNERSARVLRRLGFTVEGFARDYLFLGGAWRDHLLTSLVRGSEHAHEITGR